MSSAPETSLDSITGWENDSEAISHRSMGKGAYKPPRAAAFLGVSKNTLARWRVLGEGPKYVKIGRIVVYRVEALEAFLYAHEQ